MKNLFDRLCICILYGAASITQLKKSDIKRNKAVRICIGTIKCTLARALQVEALELPLKLRIEYLAVKYCIKVETNYNQSYHKIYSSFFGEGTI